MSIQSKILSSTRLTSLFMSSVPAGIWEKQGKKQALAVFNLASERVPAYKKHLQKHNVNATDVRTIEDFKRLPITDKKEYIQANDIEELCLDGTLVGKYTIERSSGYSGGSFFWPRIPEEDALFPKYIEYAFRQFYNIDKKQTLVIITLSLGTWTSGEKMAQALRQISMKGNCPLSVASPGTDIDETLEIVEQLCDKYEQTVIVGYPPFIKSVIDRGTSRNIDWKRLNIKLGLGGEGYSEEWREYMANLLDIPEKELLSISGGYGAADVGMNIAREYPITVLIRKLAHKDPELARDLFGDESVLPSLMQYVPSSVFIEEIDKEVLFTTKSGFCPVRYNIHDRGGIISYNEVIEILESHDYDIDVLLQDFGYSQKSVWKLPFFYVFGRSDGTVSICGPNVYPQNIEAALYDEKANRINAFKLSKAIDEYQNEKLQIFIEHKKDENIPSGKEKKGLEEIYCDLFLQKLLEVNKDFAYVYMKNSSIAPSIKIFNFGEGPFEESGDIKLRYIA